MILPALVSVMVELKSPPAVESYLAARGKVAATQATRNQIAIVEAEQQQVAQEIDGTVLFTVQRVFNGIALDVDESQIDAIAKLPEVKSVTPLEIVALDNTS